MAGLLSFPQRQGVGLLSPRYKSDDPLLKRFLDAALTAPVQAPVMADAADEAMFARNPNGAGGPIPAATPFATQPAPNTAIAQPAAPAQRNRVSGWRVLDRVLGGETVSEGLDAERLREQAVADRPAALAQQQRIAAAVGQLPVALQIAYQANPEEVGKALASNFEGYTLGAGGLRGGLNGVMSSAPTFSTVNDEIRRNDPGTGQSTIAGVAAPAYSDVTGRINANNPVTVAQNSTLVDPRTGATVAQGLVRPDLTSVAPGGQIYATDASGNTRLVGESTAQRPMSDADQAAVAKSELTVEQATQAVNRAQRLRDQIQNGQLRLGLAERAGARVEGLLGQSSPNALAIADLEQWAKQARDAILAANTGVQTDQDAVRALDNVLANMNDERLVSQYLDQFIAATTGTRSVFERDIARRSGGQSAAQQTSGPIAQDAAGNRVQWNGSAWVPI